MLSFIVDYEYQLFANLDENNSIVKTKYGRIYKIKNLVVAFISKLIWYD